MRGYRRDLETRAGLIAASRRALHLHATGRGYRFTDADRRRGKITQRAQGRFGKGRFLAAARPDAKESQ